MNLFAYEFLMKSFLNIFNSRNTVFLNKALIVWMGAFAFSMIGMVIVGEYRLYTAIPLQDSWDGSFTFYYSLLENGPSLIWLKHNEHRIILSRLLFIVDHYFFYGANWPLRLTNLVLVALSATLFWRILVSLSRFSEIKNLGVISWAIVGMLFSWIQEDNLTSEFNSQNFLAQLIPLCGLYWLYKSSQSPEKPFYFLAALFFGVAAYGTMANGLLAIPLMILYSAALSQSRVKILSLVSIGLLCTALYFKGFPSTSTNSAVLEVINSNPLGFLQFILLFLGSPFVYLFQSVGMAYMGGMLYLLCLLYSLKYLINPKRNSLELVLIFFLLYVLATALITAGGRLHFGLYNAFTSRYTTPSLMAWVAIIILLSRSIPNIKWCKFLFLAVLVLLSLGFLRYQTLVFSPRYTQITYEQEVAGLALEMGVSDQLLLRTIYQDDRVMGFAELVRPHKAGFFGQYPYQNLRGRLDQKISLPKSLPDCYGVVSAVDPIEGDEKFKRVRGWIRNENGQSEHLISIINLQDRIVGFGLSRKRGIGSDVANNASAEFIGYIKSDDAHKPLILLSEKLSCKLEISPLSNIFKAYAATPDLLKIQVNQKNVISGAEWRGSDEDKSGYPGIKIYGSYINSSKDRGSIVLKIRKGDKFYYRGGPVSINQEIEVLGTPLRSSLPYSPRWSNWYLIDFSSAELPVGEFLVRFSDNGQSPGEWSAIAVKQ